MTVSSIPSMASSGLAVNQARLDASAHHIAAATTERPQRESVPKVEAADPGAEAKLRDAEREARQLSQDIISQRVALYNFRAHVGAVQTADQAMGKLLDLSA